MTAAAIAKLFSPSQQDAAAMAASLLYTAMSTCPPGGGKVHLTGAIDYLVRRFRL